MSSSATVARAINELTTATLDPSDRSTLEDFVMDFFSHAEDDEDPPSKHEYHYFFFFLLIMIITTINE